jgi:hypothetical protein
MTNTTPEWQTKLQWLRERHYPHSMRLLAYEFDVTRLTIFYWLHYPKINPSTGKPTEPNYENRQKIDRLYKKYTLTDGGEQC